MTRQLHAITIDISLEAPYLVHGNDPGRYGLDATLLTDHRGRPILPGTLVTGRIVEAWYSLQGQLGSADADKWFGQKGVSGQGGERARLRVDDLVLKQINGKDLNGKPQGDELSRIRQNDDTGAVEPGALLLIEQIAAPGAKLRFTGTWSTWAAKEEIETLPPQLRAALLLQTQLGAYRGVGFGRLREVAVSASPIDPAPLNLPPGQDRYRLALGGDVALCVGTRSRRGNVFESSDIISGGTILGAMAQMLAARHGVSDLDNIGTSLAKNFSNLRCTHALPAQKGKGRSVPLPQSLIAYGDEIRDAWRHKTPPASLAHTPAFQTDWKGKEYDRAAAGQGWGETRKHLRIRTDIDKDGKAKDQSLFAYESVYAPRDDSGHLLTEWLFDLDLSGITDKSDQDNIAKELAELLGYGLFPLGKTDALLAVHADASAKSVWESDLKLGGQIPLLLITDTLLFPADAIADSPDADLLTIYQDAFASLAEQKGCKESLQLSHFFATQRLEGGEYLKRRYLDPKHKAYQPWVLTEAGSVFVFKVKNAENAKKLLQHWQSQGLGLPPSVKAAYGETWQDHPYRPQNGYGEVMIAPQHGFASL
ncbi:MAG: hypothetical protein KJ558_04545 [Gammaproteobacteria bacterium]|nr:hypothetical protein [Gammaproteobacteria bacterium]MBU1654090.1 hypothetical protein [Gammaproteobacteria bacterium]MBU1961371.1 hypothetical protein [Gammaproteobacteria bacterium]